jgi:predicted  nucleic acid-binding Zn-ribbon protein
MQEIIDRLTKLEAACVPESEFHQKMIAIRQQLETLHAEHISQSDELRGLRERESYIHTTVRRVRRQHNIWQEELSGMGENVSTLLDDLGSRLSAATDDAAALRGALEGIRDIARKAENDDGDLIEVHRQIYIRDLLGSVAYRAVNGLKEQQSGAALRKDIRQLQAMIDKFEEGVQQTGGWTYSSDHTLAERVQSCVNHYTRMAAEAVGDSHSFKDGVVSWLRGIAINAQSVSWASTHHEKDARLRGLIEVVETAITRINDVRFTDRLSPWNNVTDAWMKSDFPTREMRSRILKQEEEIKRLKKLAGEESQGVSDQPF